MRGAISTATGAVCLLIALHGAPARAATESAPLLPIQMADDGFGYVPLGSQDGASAGDAVELLELQSVGGRAESFHLGWLVLEHCGAALCQVRVPAELRGLIRESSRVRRNPRHGEVAPAAREPGPSAPPPTPTASPEPSPTSGRRVIAPHPEQAAAAELAPVPTPAPPRKTVAERGFRHERPTRADVGEPLTLSIFAPAPLANPVLMYRKGSESTYRAVAFEAKPDHYYTATIPDEDVAEPSVDYYVVLDTPEKPRALALGDPEAPVTVPVEGRFITKRELARYGFQNELRLMSDTVFYPSADSRDYYMRNEGEYLYRLFSTVYSVRFGAGHLFGEARNAMGDTEGVGFLYGYNELELRGEQLPVALMLRLILGANNNGVGGGGEARVRFGDELGANFVGGLTLVSSLGFVTFLQFNTHPSDRWFVSLVAAVDDLPLSGELGYRSYCDLRYQLTRRIGLLARAGVAARSIDRIGPELGVGTTLAF